MELLQILLLALVPTIAIELGVLLFVRERRRKVLLLVVPIYLAPTMSYTQLNLVIRCLVFAQDMVLTGNRLLSIINSRIHI